MMRAYDDAAMDHAAYQRRVRKMTDDALRHTIQDAKEAIRAFPENRKAGYYADEINYCAMELNRRRQAERAMEPPTDTEVCDGCREVIVRKHTLCRRCDSERQRWEEREEERAREVPFSLGWESWSRGGADR